MFDQEDEIIIEDWLSDAPSVFDSHLFAQVQDAILKSGKWHSFVSNHNYKTGAVEFFIDGFKISEKSARKDIKKYLESRKE